MAFFKMNYYSKALGMRVALNVQLPEQAKENPVPGGIEGSYKTLYLLHGLTNNHTDWMRRSSIERYAEDYQLAVVMPEVGRSWYTDTAFGAKYFTFVAEELPKVCRSYFKGMSDKREDNLIAGLSMGGYGAFKIALTYPERFGACAALSGALDITRLDGVMPLNEWRGIYGFDLNSMTEVKGSDQDVFALTRKRKAEGVSFPKMYFWCGTEDVLIGTNRDYRDLLTKLGIAHTFEETPGDHTWKCWDVYIRNALQCLLG